MISPWNVQLPSESLVHGCNAAKAPTYCGKASSSGVHVRAPITCPKCLEHMAEQAKLSRGPLDALAKIKPDAIKKWANSGKR